MKSTVAKFRLIAEKISQKKNPVNIFPFPAKTFGTFKGKHLRKKIVAKTFRTFQGKRSWKKIAFAKLGICGKIPVNNFPEKTPSVNRKSGLPE